METKAIEMVWIAVKDLKAAIAFYTNVIGLKLMEESQEYGWAELQGHEGGVRLGIAQMKESEVPKPGQNGIVTFTVANIDTAKQEAEFKGVRPVGEMQVVPDHVKMQMMVDPDGNHFQLVETLFK